VVAAINLLSALILSGPASTLNTRSTNRTSRRIVSQNSQYRHADDIVAIVHQILGTFPGYRTLHADGRLYQGVFRANASARRFTRAAHLQGGEVPVSVRFSKGGGDPFAHFSATVGMATRFYLPDGDFTNLVMLSQKLFVARTIEEFLDLTRAAAPIAQGAPPNMAGLQQYLAGNPRVANVFRMRAESPAPVSFGHTAFHAVHSFRYFASSDVGTDVRVHWIPVAGVRGQPASILKEADSEVLFAEFDERLVQGPVSFDMELELAQPGDPLNDATTLWPEGRERVVIGRLELRSPVSEAELGDLVMNHDPSKLVDGIEASDDPILQIRRGVYEVSAAQRRGGWQACPFGRAYTRAGEPIPSNVSKEK
jgi:catalase